MGQQRKSDAIYDLVSSKNVVDRKSM